MQPGQSATMVIKFAGSGGWVIDVRPVAGFTAGHIPGAVSIPLRG